VLLKIQVKGAKEHNLKNIDVTLTDGLTVVTGVSGSGKTSLVFDTLYHESRRRFQEVFAFGSPGSRLTPAKVESITGLGPAAAVGQNLLNRNPNSTLASASGLHPFLRLLYARFGERFCRRCGSPLSVLTEDEMVETIETLAKKTRVTIYAPIVNQALGSHATLLGLLSSQFGPDKLLVDGKPWQNNTLDAEKPHRIDIEIAVIDHNNQSMHVHAVRDAVQTVKALGSASVKLRTETEEFSLSGAPVCSLCGIWFEDLEPKHFHLACPLCGGSGCGECSDTGLHPRAASVRWHGLTFPELMKKSITQVHSMFKKAGLLSSAERLREEIQKRLNALVQVGLGYISLDRPSPTLSRGESQRVRLAVALTGRLEDILHVLDEPTIGQHPADVTRLIPAFKQLGGPVVYVEHDRAAAAFADRVIDIGPGAGSDGGQIIFTGTPAELWKADTPTGRYFSLRERVPMPEPAPPPQEFLFIKGAYQHNLRDVEVKIPLGRLTVVTGVSGSGKSTLVEDVLSETLAQKKAVGCKTFDGPWMKVVMVDQGPIGKNPRSTPATYTKLSDIIRDLYADVSGLSASHFSFNRPEGACPLCAGMGALEIRMKYLPSTWIPCVQCGGLRFNDEVLEKKLNLGSRTLSISDVYELPTVEAARVLREAPLNPRSRKEAEGILDALLDIGLGYLPLGQSSPTLSGGEAQRIKLAKYLGKRQLADKIIVLDEPTTGLHSQDLAGLLRVLKKLVNAGATIVVVEHNTDMIRAADWIIDLGPGAGPDGGTVIYTGPPEGLLKSGESVTGRALREESDIAPNHRHGSAIPPTPSPVISVRGAGANNLQNVDVDFPKNRLTVVTGVSGSGKSSLVRDVLEAEARRRFLETLSLYERQGVKEGPEAPVDSVSGLGVCLPVTPDRKLYEQRATVGTVTGIWRHLAILLSAIGRRACLECGAAMTRGDRWHCPRCGAVAPIAPPGRFSSNHYAAACTTCQGIGTLQVPRPEKLMRNPEKPLCGGAMYSPGFFPKGYLCKPGNGGYDIVRAFAQRHGFDPASTPWNQVPPKVRDMFLFGDPEPLEVTFTNPQGRTYTSVVKFSGFYGWIRDWDVGGTYSDIRPCSACKGARLRPQYLAVTLKGLNIHQLSELPLSRLREIPGSLDIEEEHPAAGSITTLAKRLHFLEMTGLGYLQLNRVSATLSAGEAQRVKLAGLLAGGLTGLTVLLDEPTRGLHPREVGALSACLQELRNDGNTVIVVEHDLGIIADADFIIDVGPGAGTAGGRITALGTPGEISKKNTVTGAWLQGKKHRRPTGKRRSVEDHMTIKGARENNLIGEDIHIPRRVLTGICGVSGSGKSTLLIDTLGRVLSPMKHTTSVAMEPLEPGKHDHLTGTPPRTLLVDQAKTGIQSPVSFLGLLQPLIKFYAESPEARALGLDEKTLGRRCSVCRGRGMVRMEMGFLPDLRTECETCGGTGFSRDVGDVHVRGISLPELTGLTIDETYRLFHDRENIARPLKTAVDVGLGYLVLKQPGISLSGGECQRLKIAKELCKKTKGETLYILDEPTVGLHLEDVERLISVLHRLVDEGNSVIVIEHHPHVLAACDQLLELGPGGGPEGGRVIASGTPEIIAAMDTPTAPYIKELLEVER
jgi:excinuclease ABC subunit A